MPTDLSSWAAGVAIVVALLTLASFLGGYFALRKQVEKIDDRLKEVTKALPDLARNTELQTKVRRFASGRRIRRNNNSFV